MVRLSAADSSETVSSGRLRRGSFIGHFADSAQGLAATSGRFAGGESQVPGALATCRAARGRARATPSDVLRPMNILLFGSGGREHALAWKIAASPLTDRLYLRAGQCRHRARGRMRRARSRRSCGGDRVLPGKAASISSWSGPRRRSAPASSTTSKPPASRRSARASAAARLEGSKGFTKDLCRANGIPTAAYERFAAAAPAKDYVRAHGAPIVVKADGLAAGKGVVVAASAGRGGGRDRHDVRRRASATAGAEVVIEEFLDGEEASFFALCDGETAVPLATAQDHKRAFDGDTRSQHRRHGRLFAGADVDAGAERRASWTRSCCRRCAP